MFEDCAYAFDDCIKEVETVENMIAVVKMLAKKMVNFDDDSL
jgi:hypothetical protein